MIVHNNNKVIVLGITGRQGTFWTEKMLAYGTQIVAGVNPKRAGEQQCGVPIFGSTAEAVRETRGDVAVMFIPPPMARAPSCPIAILDRCSPREHPPLH